MTRYIVRRLLGLPLMLLSMSLILFLLLFIRPGNAAPDVSAVRRNSWLDYVFRLSSIIGISVPVFWTATLLLTLPAIWWAWTPLARDYVTLPKDPIKNLQIIVWPALVLSLSSSAYVARIVRSSMLEALFSDHVRTARAKGLQERVIIIRHVLRT